MATSTSARSRASAPARSDALSEVLVDSWWAVGLRGLDPMVDLLTGRSRERSVERSVVMVPHLYSDCQISDAM